MTATRTLARWFLGAGAGLGFIGLVLWFVLKGKIHLTFPPFLITSLLCFIYGAACLVHDRRASKQPRP